MELKQLEHFLAVAEERHFTRAARRMNIVQSGLSSSIRGLELELKADLFVRTTRRVELTAAGQALYEKAQRVLAAAREAREAVDAVQGLSRGTLSIGAGPNLGAFIDLPALLDRFHTRYPDIEIHLIQSSAAELLDKIRDNNVDLGFVALSEPSPGIATTMVAHEPLLLTCPLDHPLAGRRNLSLAMLRDEAFIDFPPGWGIRRLVDRACLEAGIQRHITFEVADLGTLLDLVARGLGIALVPQRLALQRAAPGQKLPVATASLDRPEIHWRLVLASAADANGEPDLRNPAARAFLEMLKAFRQPAPDAAPPASANAANPKRRGVRG